MKIMVKRIIFTIVLIIIGLSSFYIGLNPFGLLAAWQDQNSETEKGIQKSLSVKSEQVFEVWSDIKSIHGAVNVLQSTEVSSIYPVADPLEILVPLEKTLGRISVLFLVVLKILIFEKILLAISIPIVLMIVIPICILISVSIIWKNKDKKEPHRITISSFLISVVILFAIPGSLLLSTLVEDKILSNNVNGIVSSISENEENAAAMESELRGLRRVSVTIMNYVTSARDICNAVINDMVKFLVIFLMINILLPVFAVLGIYKITKYYSKMILAK